MAKKSSIEKIQKIGVASNLKFAIGFLVVGIIMLIVSIIKFNKWNTATSIIVILVSLFLIIFGAWGTKRMWKEM